jgi:hypothetical protein
VSNDLAIAAATRTIVSLLSPVAPSITAFPLDKARDGVTSDQVNVFLYQTVVSAAWRNVDPPKQVRSGEAGHPALPLNLHYLLTAFGEDEARAHGVLGAAMRILHDHPVLAADEIRNATVTDLPDSDLHLQPERIRITPLPLSTDDLFKLWSGFQTNYRLSAAYELAVVLLDSKRLTRTPLPVLRQGPEDHGPVATAGGAPALTAVLPPPGDPVAVLGSRVRLQGTNLGSVSTVRFASRLLEAPIDLVPEPGSSEERTVALPSGAPAIEEWPAGLFMVSVVSTPSGSHRSVVSEPVAFYLGTQITVNPLSAPPGPADFTVTATPRLRAGQRVSLLFGDRPVNPTSVATPADPTQPSTLTFHLDAVVRGTYLIRLRVDGVDSNPVVWAGTPPKPDFDTNQQVVVP